MPAAQPFKISALRLSLPYHDERMPPELRRADYIVSANVGRTVQVCRQAVLDARRAMQWLAPQGYESIGILGTSLGSCLAMLTTAHEPLVKAAALNHISPYFADVVWDGLSTAHVRSSARRPDRSRAAAADLDADLAVPVYRARPQGKRVLLVYARYDLTFPVELSRMLVDEFRAAAGRARADRAALRPLQHRRHAVQVDGRLCTVALPRTQSL